jgi:putative peptidoglycan lipid II flippase
VRPIQRIFSKSRDLIINRSSDSLGYIAFGMAIIMLFTKILGLVRLQLLTSIYGVKSAELDIFNAANTIPEFIFIIIAIGGINAALIPVLTQTSLDENAKKVKEVFSSIVNIFFLTLLVICLFVFAFAPQIISSVFKIKVSNSESPLSPEQVAEFIKILRILIFSPIILCVSSIFSSILQIKRRFFVTQLAPLFYNLAIIITTLFLPFLNKDTTFLAWGVLFASLIHFVIQLPAIFSAKISYSPFVLNLRDFYVIKTIKQTIPRIIGLSSDYIVNIFQTVLALRLATGSLNSYRLANSLREIPITMFGIAIAQSVFPRMSEIAKTQDIIELQKLFSRAVRTILFWTLPISAIFIVLRTPLVQLLFSIFNKNISFSDTSLISYSLLFLSLGIVFYSLLHLTNRVFFSLDDSVTPTIVSLIIIFLEIGMTYIFVNLFSHFNNISLNPFVLIQNSDNLFTKGDSDAAIGGIALASSISIFLHLSILCRFLKKKKLSMFYESRFIIKKFVSFAVMLTVGLLSFKLLDTFFDKERIAGILIFTLNVSVIMGLTYYFCEKLLKDEDIDILDHPIMRVKKGFVKFYQLFRANKLRGVNT